ncbi:MAG TPA: NAD-dependent epimerase/dehydratase family protein [Planctomycetota bacterium]|nr:NAD-dependent epimerase/dehydratase family protein [Planctomycetota bacterium]
MAWTRYLVTGAGGFIGASLVRRLLESEGEVAVLVREDTDLWRLADVLPRLRVIRGDVAEPGIAARAVSEARPEAVYHLAAHGGSESQKDIPRILRTNLMGTSAMLDACTPSPVRLFVHAGSSSEYGYKQEPMRETDLLEPNSVYAVGKAAATHLCRLTATRSSFAIVTLRLFSVYGPWESPTRLVPTILRRCLRGEPLEMVSRGTARDFVYVGDIIQALVATDRLVRASGEVVNLGTGTQTTMEEFVAAALEVTGSRSEVRWGAMPARVWDTAHWVASCEKAARILGWRASTGLREGLRRALEWIRTRDGGTP